MRRCIYVVQCRPETGLSGNQCAKCRLLFLGVPGIQPGWMIAFSVGFSLLLQYIAMLSLPGLTQI
jgi:hypothetical protein